MQAVWVWVTLLPVLVVNGSRSPLPLGALDAVGEEAGAEATVCGLGWAGLHCIALLGAPAAPWHIRWRAQARMTA